MRVLVAGSVNWTDPAPIDAALDRLLLQHAEIVIITGMADGVDQIARQWAIRNRVRLWAERLEQGDYPEPMHRYNERMLAWAPDVVIACKPNLDIERNPTAGTEHMCLIAEAGGVCVQRLQVGDQVS